MWVVSSRQCAGVAPAGGSVSRASTRLSVISGGSMAASPGARRLGPFDCNLARSQRKDGLPRQPAGRGGQNNCLAAQFGPLLDAAEQARAVRQHAVLGGAYQQFHAIWFAGEFLVNV